MPRRRRAPAPGKPEASSPPVTIDVLTADDLQCVFSLLTAHGLSCAIAVCKSWAAVEERTRELIWQNLVERQFPGSEAGAAFMLCSSARSRFRLLARDPNADEGARSRGQHRYEDELRGAARNAAALAALQEYEFLVSVEAGPRPGEKAQPRSHLWATRRCSRFDKRLLRAAPATLSAPDRLGGFESEGGWSSFGLDVQLPEDLPPMPMGLSIEVEENWRGTGRRNENVDMVGRPIEVSLAVRQKGGDGKCSALLFPITIDPADADSLEGVDIAVTEHELIAHFALSHEVTAPALDELQKLAWPTAAPMTGPHGSGGRAGRDPCWRAHVVLGVQRPSEDRAPSLRWTRLAVGFRWSCGDGAGAADDEDLQLVSVQRLLRHELIASGALGLAPRPLEDEYECFVTIAHVRPGTLSPPSGGGAPRTWEDGAAIFLTLAAVRAEPDEQGTACLEVPVERRMPLAFEWPELQDGAADLIDAHGHGQRLGHGEPLSLTVHVRRKHDGAAATFLRVVLDPDELLLEHVDEIETPGGGEEIDLEFGYSATAYAAVGLEANARMTWPTAAKAPPPHETDGPQWQMTTFLTVAKPEGGARRSDEWRMLVLNFRWVDCHWCAPVYPTFLPTVELETVRQLLEFGDLDWVVPAS